MADPLLSDLCKICHINPHKYRCPRCFTLTCSLACVKRHKKWAQCNGTRNPAAYLKRSELATPAGIDQDFNFLTSIERKIDSAERDANHRGVVLRDADTRSWRERGSNGPMKGEAQMQAAVERCKVVIDKAPKGMARAKQNKTRWHKKARCLRWTVEWVHDDGRKELGEFLETRPISEAYEQQFGNAEPPKKKRRLSESKEDVGAIADINAPSTEAPKLTAPSHPSLEPSNASAPGLETTQPPVPLKPEAAAPALADQAPDQTSSITTISSTPPIPHPNPLNFYLFLPSTPTSSRVLIPLSPSSTLSTSLEHRLVLEFPTIYVLRDPPEKLPEGFMTEEEYIKGLRKGEVRGDLKGLIEEVEDGEVGVGGLDGGRKEVMDGKRLADMVQRDLGRGSI